MTEGASRVWRLGPGGYLRALGNDPDDLSFVGMRVQGPELNEEIEVVPRSVADSLIDALEEIVDDLSVPNQPPPWVAHALQTAQLALDAHGREETTP